MQKMIHIISLPIVASFLVLAGCVTTKTSVHRIGGNASIRSDAEEWNLMTGKWYGNQKMENGSTREWLVERRRDGTSTTIFVTKAKDGSIDRVVEVGKWGISGNIYFTIFEGWIKGDTFEPAIPQDQYTRDAYKILSLTEVEFEYSSIEESDVFRVVRVSNEYEI